MATSLNLIASIPLLQFIKLCEILKLDLTCIGTVVVSIWYTLALGFKPKVLQQPPFYESIKIKKNLKIKSKPNNYTNTSFFHFACLHNATR